MSGGGAIRSNDECFVRDIERSDWLIRSLELLNCASRRSRFQWQSYAEESLRPDNGSRMGRKLLTGSARDFGYLPRPGNSSETQDIGVKFQRRSDPAFA